MKILYQKSIAEIAAQPLPRSEEMYEPTKSERAKGNWAVVAEKFDENGEPDLTSQCHVIPTHGMIHQISEQCPCEPYRHKHRNGGPDSIVHRISQ